jgi:hypothetical protein
MFLSKLSDSNELNFEVRKPAYIGVGLVLVVKLSTKICVITVNIQNCETSVTSVILLSIVLVFTDFYFCWIFSFDLVLIVFATCVQKIIK